MPSDDGDTCEDGLTEGGRMPELNDIICPTCECEGRIATTWSAGKAVNAQWVCSSGHKWSSRSEWRDDLANYVTVSITNLEVKNA